MVLQDKRNHNDCFFVCDLRPDFEKVELDVRRSLEPFKDLDSRFDPSSIALTKRSRTPTVYVFFLFFSFSSILSLLKK